MLKLLNWNVGGANTKKPTLIAHNKIENYDIITLQETLIKPGNRFKFNGYNVYTTPHENGFRGLAILVKSTIPVKKIINPIHCGDNVEVLAVKLTLQDTTLDIYNIYRKITRGSEGELDLTQLFAHAVSTNTLITGDFNAHHTILSSPTPNNETGAHIVHVLDNFQNIAIVNNGQPTHIRGGRLDLTFITATLRTLVTWSIHPTLMSDHFATVTEIEMPQLPPIPPPPPRWDLSTADWGIFQRELLHWAENYTLPDDINQLEQDLTNAFHRAADKAMRIKTPGNYTYKDSWYYCKEVRELKTTLNRVRKLHRRRPTPENLELLIAVNHDIQQQLANIRNEKWMEWCTQISQHTSLSQLWKFLKSVSGKYSKSQATHPHPEQEAERLAEKFANRTKTTNLPLETIQIQNQLAPMRNNAIEQACQQIADTDTPYTIEELRLTYKKGKDTAPGADRITYTMISNMGEAGENITLSLINKTHTERVRPNAWNEQDTQPIPKPKDPENPRPIALVSCIEKTAEKMALKRLQYKIGPLHPHLYAYQEGVGTQECITDVLSYIDSKKAAVAFIDFEKAFELASPTVMLFSLVRKGTRGHILAWTKNYLFNRKARVKFQGHLSTYKNLENGTPQGGILSPFLFNILMENLATLTLPNNVDIFIYADDVCVVSKGAHRITNLQKALDTISDKTKELGLKINTNKTKTMMIKCPIPNHTMLIDNNHIEWVDNYMYLGVYIDTNLTFNQEVKYLRERAKTRLSTMKYMTSLQEGAKLNVQKSYYIACTRSLIDYAAPVLTHLNDTQKQSLEVIQNNAARLMLGAPIWTKLANLRGEVSLPSLQNRIKARNTCIITKALTSNRNSYTKIRATAELRKDRRIQTYNTYSKQLSDCAKDFNITNTLLELRPDTLNQQHNTPPWESHNTTYNYTLLPRAKEDCTLEELKQAALTSIANTEMPNTVVFYTDGTVDPTTNTTGAAVYSSRYTACWRTTDTASTMQTELIAMKQALTYSLENEEGPITIHTDCKSAMQALQQNKIKENKVLIKDILYLLHQHKNTNRHVTINWIPSHIGIPGNDKADELAKTTKHIDQVQIHIQPTISQIKSQLTPKLRTQIQEEIRTQARAGSFSCNWYLKATELTPHLVNKHTPRKLAVIIHRLRLGYKANWQMIDIAARECNYCNHSPDEPLLHYLLECPQTATLRGNRNIPNIQHPDSCKIAANLVKHIIENIETHYNTLLDMPPPR